MKTHGSNVPLFIQKVSKKYWKNTFTGKYIRAEHLDKYLSDNNPQTNLFRYKYNIDK